MRPSRRRDLRVAKQIAIEAPGLRKIARLQRDVRDADDLRAHRLNEWRVRTSDGNRGGPEHGERECLRQKSPPSDGSPPYRIAWIDSAGRQQRSVCRVNFLPRDLQIDGTSAPQIRSRGIFDVVVLLRLEDYALLAGSVDLFVILALVMYMTRKMNWYELKLGGEPG
ncbi:MAG: hypothetical protein DMF84_04395 [Acidobacteria bacterium]|nr:MAG: hypothetical protein DMF84_04395 [Acidobacteriota bacterium]